MDINQILFSQIFALSHKFPILDFLMILGAEYLIYIVGIATFAILIIQKKRMTNILFLFISLAVSFLLVKLINLFFYTPRPFIDFPITPLITHPNTSSFPSLHSAGAFSLAFVFYFLKSKLAPVFLLAAIWIALARIYVGVHYPFDILGGLVVGLISVYLVWRLAQQPWPQYLSRPWQKGKE